MLDVTNPTVVQDSDIANTAGANARRLSVLGALNNYFGEVIFDVALFTDELHNDHGPYPQNPEYTSTIDRHDSEGYELRWSDPLNTNDPHLGALQAVVTRADIAIPRIHKDASDSLKREYLANVFGLKAFAILQMAEDICAGFPINGVIDELPVFGPPYTNDSAVRYALALTDSALKQGRDSVRFLNFARVIRGRAFLDLGHYAEAAAAVHDVPTDFTYAIGGFAGGYVNPTPCMTGKSCQRVVQGNGEGENGLPFASSRDPRTPSIYKGPSLENPNDSIFIPTKYPSFRTPTIIVSGLEARLIEAEAALNANDPQWFSILNTLRATIITPAMPAIDSMPTTKLAQVNLLYAERASWLYLTGRRLGDLRRLIKNYGRDPETVFPTGAYPSGGTYAKGTAIPFVYSVQSVFNPQIKSGCQVR